MVNSSRLPHNNKEFNFIPLTTNRTEFNNLLDDVSNTHRGQKFN